VRVQRYSRPPIRSVNEFSSITRNTGTTLKRKYLYLIGGALVLVALTEGVMVEVEQQWLAVRAAAERAVGVV
jgi:hypothetical protein